MLISTITPLSPGPKDTLRITGRVVSRGGPVRTGVQVSLHLGRSVASRAELQGLRAQPVPQLLVSGTQQDLGDGTLTSGNSLSFTITEPISDLFLPGAGVYPMQVTAIGIEDGSYRDLATASTFLPYIPADAAGPATPLAWVVPLTADPTLLADGTLTAAAPKAGQKAEAAAVTSVKAGGRLRGLLDALGGARSATATLDPTIVQALLTAANGRYRVTASPQTGGTDVTTHPASAEAAQWLADLRAAGRVSLIGLPYADPDTEALLRGGERSLLDAARRRGSQVLPLGLGAATRRLTTSVAVPPAGAVDTAGVNYYRNTVRAKGLLLESDAVPAAGDNPSAAATVPNTSERLLLADSVLTSLVTTGQGGPRLAEQELIAELAEAHLEDRFTATPTAGGTAASAQPLIIAPASGWNPTPSWAKQVLRDTGRLSWLRQVPVSSLLTSPAQPRAGLSYPDRARSAELSSSLVAAAGKLTVDSSRLFATSAPAGTPQPLAPATILAPIRDAAMSAVSSRWRGHPLESAQFQQSGQAALATLQSQVRAVASPQVTLTSRKGRVPVTIENDLQAAVDVSLVLSSLDRSRVSSDTVVRRTVRAGQKVQVEVEVKAASAGTFPVRLSLFTPDGLPLGVPAQVLVRSTTYGVVATIFTVVALALLGLAVLVRGARALIRRSRGAQPPASAP